MICEEKNYYDISGNQLPLKDANIYLLKKMKQIRKLLYLNDIDQMSDNRLEYELTEIREEIKNYGKAPKSHSDYYQR